MSITEVIYETTPIILALMLVSGVVVGYIACKVFSDKRDW